MKAGAWFCFVVAPAESSHYFAMNVSRKKIFPYGRIMSTKAGLVTGVGVVIIS